MTESPDAIAKRAAMEERALVERVARAMLAPLGYTKQASDNWDSVWVGNISDTPETGSLAYLCHSLARAAIAEVLREISRGLARRWVGRTGC